MRIVGGRFRGTSLAGLGAGDPAARLRPTSDRVRESLFNILTGGRLGDPVTDARVLDLFAGTGALGLEALSRGAAHVTFVDSGRTAQGLLRKNVARLGVAGETRIIAADATRLGPATDAPATLVFLDPPYGTGLGGAALEAARSGGWIAPAATIVWEDSAEAVPPEGFRRLDARRYGDTWITFLEATPA